MTTFSGWMVSSFKIMIGAIGLEQQQDARIRQAKVGLGIANIILVFVSCSLLFLMGKLMIKRILRLKSISKYIKPPTESVQANAVDDTVVDEEQVKKLEIVVEWSWFFFDDEDTLMNWLLLMNILVIIGLIIGFFFVNVEVGLSLVFAPFGKSFS